MSQYTIEFTQIAIKTLSKYKKSNPFQYKKLVKLLDDRLIYDIYEEKVTVLVLTVEGHYGDK